MNTLKSIWNRLQQRSTPSSPEESAPRVREAHASRIGKPIKSDEPGANDSVYLVRTRKGIVVVY